MVKNDAKFNEISYELLNKQLTILDESISWIKIYNVNGMLLYESNSFSTNSLDLSRIEDKLFILYLENKDYFKTFKLFNK